MSENRQIVVRELPCGPLTEEHYASRTVAIPEAGDGEVLCRTLAVAIAAGTLAALQGSASYAAAPSGGMVMPLRRGQERARRAARVRPHPHRTSRAMKPRATALLASALLAWSVAGGCASPSPPEDTTTMVERRGTGTERSPRRYAYFGDLHVHTMYSLDAFIFGALTTPDDAYRFAKGEAIAHPSGHELKLASGPLDFYAVTDHGALLGHMRAMTDPRQRIHDTELGRRVRAARSPEERLAVMASLGAYLAPEKWRQIFDADVLRSAWEEIGAAAERHYVPGRFTTFVAYEYTSGPQNQNLHRNVIFRGTRVPATPFTMIDSLNPEDLWEWMEGLRAQGIEALAIPHNSNESNGLMFRRSTFGGEPLDAAYAQLRMRNEPLVEVTQVKGTSETHPLLSPNDEWAGFELYPYLSNISAGGAPVPSDPPGSYARDAYLAGLEMEERGGFNPYRFGLIGSSDTHNAASAVEESSFVGKVGLVDGTPERRGSVPLAVPLDQPAPDGPRYADARFRLWGAAGLAGVWAEENTREAIYDALRRRETFATSGPRIRVRFFAGYELPEGLAADPDAIAAAYARGVPMGGDLVANEGRAPRFLAWASRDPASAPLERLQIVKGWVEDGAAHEQVLDIACSGASTPDPGTHRCPDNGATVDLADCSFGEEAGAGELRVLWSDPAFVSSQRAFYYLRVLENPTCRWSTWDALRAGVEPRPDLPATLQERAWTSPIWYVP